MLKRLHLLCALIGLIPALPALAAVPGAADWRALDARWRPDANPWAKQQVWEGYLWSEGWSERDQFYPQHCHPAGSLHVILRNASKRSDTILLTHVDGAPIADVATSPERAGRVIWYRVESPRLGSPETGADRNDAQWSQMEPAEVAPGGWAECSIRLRSLPKRAARLRFQLGSGGTLEAPVAIKAPRVRFESISFSSRIDRAFIYLRSLDGKRIGKGSVQLDGRNADRTSRWTQGTALGDFVLLDVKLQPPWESGSHHLIEVHLHDGQQLVQPVRAWDGYFAIGLYGVLEPDRVKAAKAHGINAYFSGGISPMLDELSLNVVPAYNVGEGRTRTAKQSGVLYYQNKDEPDAHDFTRGEALPVMQRLGVNAQAEVLPLMRYQRARDPQTPNLLLVDNTYKPLQWYVYGQIPDIYCTDPYVPLNGRQVDYVPRALEAARDACTPRPLVSVLWACGLSGQGRRLGDRPPTPEEERMMVFYAVGCGVKGIAYFIDLTATTGEGQFSGLSDNKPLWEEVERTNRDLAALAPHLSIGCPMAPPRADGNIWWRSLLCGPDHVVLIVVNQNHYIGFETKYTYAWHEPARNASISLALPNHFRRCQVVEISGGRLRPMRSTVRGSELRLQLDKVDTARAFLISAAVK